MTKKCIECKKRKAELGYFCPICDPFVPDDRFLGNEEIPIINQKNTPESPETRKTSKPEEGSTNDKS